MPTYLKYLTVFRQQEGYGWTEVHYGLDSSGTPDLRNALDVFTANIAAKRALFLGEDCAIVGYRVSYPRTNVTASYGLQEFIPGQVGKHGSAPSLSLAVAMKDTSWTRTKIIHVRGFWDDVEIDGVYQPGLEVPPTFALRLAQWKDSLIQGGYGWLSKDATLSSKGVTLNYVVSVDGIVTFTLASPGMPAGTVGTQQQVRFSRLNRSNSVLNRSILCQVVNATTLVSVAPHAATAIVSTGRFNYRGTSFIPYARLGSVSLGERRMGKPLNRYPGRAAVRPTA